MRWLILVLLLLLLPFAAIGGVAGIIGYDVVHGSYEHLDKNRIIDILSKESVVYYSDGQSQLASLFGAEHRQYVQVAEMPKFLLDAVVAAEDDGFYRHFGVDFQGLIRAFYRNIVFNKREGASTITMQTVKNLYGREQTTLKVKFLEMINSMKMERKYSKKEILEFYLNQFHVTGNGRGVGIAAKYYFNKDVGELTLTEAAFIAGSVKGPERYNPFTKRTMQGQVKAREAAKARKNYVLRRMVDTKVLSQAEHDRALLEDVPFNMGRFQSNQLAVTELVQRQLGKPEILQAIGVDTVEQVGSLGLRITTTLNRGVQQASEYGVRQNLSRLEIILSGFQKENPSAFVPVQVPEKFGFHVAKIVSVNRTPKTESITVSLGVPECNIPTDGIERIAKLLNQTTYAGVEKSKAAFLGTLNSGDYVLISVREEKPQQTYVCDLERRPRIQGGLIALDKGRVISMVGGFSPQEYNRAVLARRQPGSTFKTLTYYPALQLGWNILEPLLNVRSVYQWQGQFYYPRPDHAPTSMETTFAGASAKSENLASVWLLSHLLDKLSPEQFSDLMKFLGLYNPGEPENMLLERIGKMFNVKLADERLRGGLFEMTRNDLLNDVSIARNQTLRILLKGMIYGTGWENELERVTRHAKDLTPKERAIRTNVLRNNFLRWRSLADAATNSIEHLRTERDAGSIASSKATDSLRRFRMTADNRLAFMSSDLFRPEEVTPLLPATAFRNSSFDELVAAVDLNKELLNEENVLLDGVVPLSLIKDIAREVDNRLTSLAPGVMEQLYVHDDFRYSLGMYYAHKMVKAMGVESDIQWVPSYPLGTNAVSLAELALAYQTIATGEVYRYFESQLQDNQLVLIQRIEDSKGQLLWEADAKKYKMIDDVYSPPMFSILHGTVTNGTGFAAHNSIFLQANDPVVNAELQKMHVRVPAFGKTGTTNDYVNATFVGFLPYPEEMGTHELSRENVYTIAAYVGYDTNEPMKKRGFKVAGGTGALPAFIETANALIREEQFAERLEWKGLSAKNIHEVPFDFNGGTKAIVPLHSGAILNASEAESSGDGSDVITFSDYAARKEGSLSVYLPGVINDGAFIAKPTVKFFKPRKHEQTKAYEPEVAPPPAQVTPFQPQIEEENSSSADDIDLFTMPGLPPALSNTPAP